MKTLTWLILLATAPSFTDNLNFDSLATGGTPTGWSSVPSTGGAAPSWKVVKDSSAPSQPNVLAYVPDGVSGAEFPMAILDDATLRDGEVTVRFKPSGGNREQDAGLVWRYRDPRNYYVVRADAHENNVVVYRVANGTLVPLVPRGRPAGAYAARHYVNAGAWGTLKVVFKGPVLNVYCDHRRVLRIDDRSYTGPGKVGLWTRGNSMAYFDNFRLVRKQ